MSTVAENTVKQFNKKTAKLVQKYNVKSAGTGTAFWKVLMDEKVSDVATIRVSTDKTKVYLRVAVSETQEVNLHLGMHYSAIQSFSIYEGQELKIVLAPRIPNPALTEADIEGQRANIEKRALAEGLSEAAAKAAGETAVANIKAARANDSSGELCLVSFIDPADEE